VRETSLVEVDTTGPEVGTIKTLSNHRPTQESSFLVKTGGPSGLTRRTSTTWTRFA